MMRLCSISCKLWGSARILPPEREMLPHAQTARQTLLTGLQALPDELLLDIFDGFHTLQDLCSVSRICRLLHGLVGPMLYGSFTSADSTTISMFLRTIIVKPVLARYVATATLRGVPHCEFDTSMLKPLRHNLHEAFHKARLSRAQEQDWVKGLCARDNWDSCVALLLFLLPNLKELTLRPVYTPSMQQYESQMKYLARVLRISEYLNLPVSSDIPGCLNMLQHVRIESPYQSGTLGSSLALFQALPSVTTYTIVGLVDWSSYLAPLSSTANITHLSILNCALSPSTVTEFVSQFPNLKQLDYVIDGTAMSQRTWPTGMSSEAWTHSLSHLHTSLEELSCGGIVCMDSHWDPLQTGDALAHFRNLRRYRTVMTNLIPQTRTREIFEYGSYAWLSPIYTTEALIASIKNLPAGLEEVVIWKAVYDVLEWMSLLLAGLTARTCHLTRLRHVKVVFDRIVTSTTPHGAAALKKRLEEEAMALGIRLEITTGRGVVWEPELAVWRGSESVFDLFEAF